MSLGRGRVIVHPYVHPILIYCQDTYTTFVHSPTFLSPYLCTTTIARLQEMPWDPIRLNSGHYIPSIAFGTWTLGNGQGPVDQIEQALETGFDHIDTAQAYRNELETGTALQESGLLRSDVFVTTKYSGIDGLDISNSIRNSLSNVSDVVSFRRESVCRCITSSMWIMLTYTSSTLLVSPFQISQQYGLR